MTAPAPDLGPLVGRCSSSSAPAGHAIVIVGDRGNGIEQWYVNRAAAAMLGYTVEEFCANTLLENDRAGAASAREADRTELPRGPAAARRARVPDDPQGRHTRADRDHDGTGVRSRGASHTSTMMRDVGAHQQTQLSLLEADRIGLVGALAAGFAHEINNPLTSVLLNLRSLRKQLAASLPDQAQAPALRCLDDVTTGAERIASNVRALQTLATRSATQERRPRRRGVVGAPPRGADARAARAGDPSDLPGPAGHRGGVADRPGRARDAAVLELRLRRRRAGVEQPDHGRRRGARGEVVVEVSDNGRDLTADEVRAAFDPFFRSSARGAGVGVGLGVARSVATTLGGAVTLAPRPGGGAVITMRLPPAQT